MCRCFSFSGIRSKSSAFLSECLYYYCCDQVAQILRIRDSGIAEEVLPQLQVRLDELAQLLVDEDIPEQLVSCMLVWFTFFCCIPVFRVLRFQVVVKCMAGVALVSVTIGVFVAENGHCDPL